MPRAASVGKKTRIKKSKSSKAGIAFPVSRVKKQFKQIYSSIRFSDGAAVYLAASLEYLSAEILELAGNSARDHKRKRIVPRNVQLAISNDQELSELLKHTTLPSGGVVVNIHRALLSAKSISRNQKTAPKKAATSLKKSRPLLVKTTSIGSKDARTGLTILNEKVIGPGGEKLTVMKGDIADVNVDAVVHSSGGGYYTGGQVGQRLSKVGGARFAAEVEQCRRDNGPIPPLHAVAMKSNCLRAKYVLHCNGPIWNQTDDAVGDLSKCISHTLLAADKADVSSIAFPSVGSGNAGYPKQVAAETILRAIARMFSVAGAFKSLRHVYFILFDRESVDVYVSELERLV